MTKAQARRRRYSLRYRTFCRKLDRDWRRWCRHAVTEAMTRRRRQPAIERAILRLRTEEAQDDWRPTLRPRLRALMDLAPDWDGYQGQPVSAENAQFAFFVLTQWYAPRVPAPQIVPGTGGDLQIEWHTVAGDLELHITGPRYADLHIYAKKGKSHGARTALAG